MAEFIAALNTLTWPGVVALGILTLGAFGVVLILYRGMS